MYNFSLHCHYQSVGRERREKKKGDKGAGSKDRKEQEVWYFSHDYVKITERNERKQERLFLTFERVQSLLAEKAAQDVDRAAVCTVSRQKELRF